MPKKFHYNPMLRWKAGEQGALANLSSKSGITPFILLQREQYAATKSPPKKPRKRVPKTPPLAAADVFVGQADKAWGAERFFLDASDLPATPSGHHLDQISAAARAAGLQIVPAISLSGDAAYRGAVERMAATDGRGVALRVSFDQMASATSWSGSWFAAPSDTDLIVDLGNSIASMAGAHSLAIAAFSALHRGERWRSVTVAGGSIPPMLTGYKIGETPLARYELDFWTAISGASLPYSLDFGDYATIAPDALNLDVEGSFPVNAKYTIGRQFLIYHGVRPRGVKGVPMQDQLRNYARTIHKRPGRGPLANCWGDIQIDKIATSGASPGSPGVWVKYSVNRHIELTRANLP